MTSILMLDVCKVLRQLHICLGCTGRLVKASLIVSVEGLYLRQR